MNYTADQLALEAHIKAENAQFTADALASGATMMMTPMEEIDLWIALGVNTIEQYKHYSLSQEISDMEKELYGIRLRNDYSNATVAQLEAELNDLYRYARAEQEEQKREAQEEELRIREMQKRNSYKPNLAFAGLRELVN